MRRELQADLVQPQVARVALRGGGAHLDELVGGERPVDLGDHLVGEPLVADEDDGIQLVRLGAQRAAPRRGEDLGHGRILRLK